MPCSSGRSDQQQPVGAIERQPIERRITGRPSTARTVQHDKPLAGAQGLEHSLEQRRAEVFAVRRRADSAANPTLPLGAHRLQLGVERRAPGTVVVNELRLPGLPLARAPAQLGQTARGVQRQVKLDGAAARIHIQQHRRRRRSDSA